MNARNGWMRTTMILAVGAIGLAFTVKGIGQVQTTTEEKHAGAPTKEVKVVNAEVISVQGNNVYVKMEDGTIRHIANVADSARATVDGREVGVHELKPGMHLQKTITTTTTPKVIVTTKTVTGKVWHVNAPLSLILTMEDGTNQQFKVPNGQKFTINGKETDVFGLKKGMIVSATKVVEEPLTQVEHEAQVSGHMPPPPPAPASDMPVLVAVAEPAPAAAAELPHTGSNLPLMGLLGLMLIAGSFGARMLGKVRG